MIMYSELLNHSSVLLPNIIHLGKTQQLSLHHPPSYQWEHRVAAWFPGEKCFTNARAPDTPNPIELVPL